MILDSGNRSEFSTGAVRDCKDGNGRMDLVPLGVVGAIMNEPILINLEQYMRTGDKKFLVDSFKEFAIKEYGDLNTAILEVSIHYFEGSKKYQPRNWERGINLSSYIDSAARHFCKWRRGDQDESHSRAFLWNLLGALWTHANVPEMIDLPFANIQPIDPLDKLDGIAKTIEEEHLNKLVSLWQKYHAEESKCE